MQIDKYARDAELWRRDAEATLAAANLLFAQKPDFWFAAAILGHHALEMLLKSALIQEGFTVANGKPEDGYVWGHCLEKLAKLLASKRQDFSLQDSPRGTLPLGTCPTYFARYDMFFDELRYPHASPNIVSLGPGQDETELLAQLMDLIRPFACPWQDVRDNN